MNRVECLRRPNVHIRADRLLACFLAMLLFVAPLPASTAAASSKIYYVTSWGTGNCSTWLQSCPLLFALAIAGAGEEVWVAGGGV